MSTVPFVAIGPTTVTLPTAAPPSAEAQPSPLPNRRERRSRFDQKTVAPPPLPPMPQDYNQPPPQENDYGRFFAPPPQKPVVSIPSPKGW